MTSFLRSAARSLGRESGFTMIIALGVMLVTSLLLVATFTAANGDIHLSHTDTTQKQAYFAALAGVQEYEYKLQNNPNYWQTCEQPSSTVPEEASERYEVKLLVASTAAKGTTACSTASPFTSMIESGGSLANTFRIESIGYSGSSKRSVIATFQVVGFLNYVYYTNYEQGDPAIFGTNKECEKKYYKEWVGKFNCESIEFTSGDSVNGPMHTNDAAKIGGTATFGREGHTPADAVEIKGGSYPTVGCKTSATYFTATKCYTEGTSLVPPESDSSLLSYVEPENEFTGVTYLVLKGNQVAATYFSGGKEVKETIEPENGLIYVRTNPSTGCGYKYEPENSDNSTETSKESGCGNVYVSGSYSKSLTIAAENDVIINGSTYPTSVAGKLGSTPTGTTTLGLIATHYVRVYHPCSGNKNGTGSLTNPWIYAAILSTAHSFVVDNFACGAKLGELNVDGAIAQNYRGTVGTGAGTGTGYLKEYIYDERLATDEPPYFLAPLKSGWKIIRETAPTGG